jgi:hypothetical protein
MYFLTNMFSQLPAKLSNGGKADTLLLVYVGNDLAAQARRIDRITVRVLLSDPTAEELPKAERLEQVTIATRGHLQPGGLRNIPPAKSIVGQIELRLNNALLGGPWLEQGWLVFKAASNQFAVGHNLMGVRINQRPPMTTREVLIEKLEVHVFYR